MINFLFWNLNKKPLESLVTKLALEHNVDVIMLAEYVENPTKLLTVINQDEFRFFLNESLCQKIKVYSRFRDSVFPSFEESKRYTIRQLKLPQTEEILLAVVHIPSKIDFDNDSQEAEIEELSRFIENAEERAGHSRTILVGDLNMNPFEKGLVKTTGLHAVMSRQIAKKGSRIVQDREYQFFYNPMWNFLGDFSPFVSGTHYYQSTKHIAYFWNMFDQVLIRPELLDKFLTEDLKIIETVNGKSLLDKNGLPDKNFASDHLPIFFSLNI
jgi:hypothetical protein